MAFCRHLIARFCDMSRYTLYDGGHLKPEDSLESDPQILAQRSPTAAYIEACLYSPVE